MSRFTSVSLRSATLPALLSSSLEMEPVYSRLPTELWIIILKLAVSSPWGDEAFSPPTNDFSFLSGFAEASEEFKALAKVAAEAWPLSIRLKRLDEVVALGHSFDVVKCVFCDLPLLTTFYGPSRHILIERGSRKSTDAGSLLLQLSYCRNLSSLSLPPIGKANWHIFAVSCQSTAIKNTLRRLDMSYEDHQNWGTLWLDFPNLVELRLAKWDARPPHRNVGLPVQYNGQSWIQFGNRWKFLAVSLCLLYVRNLLSHYD